MKHLAPISALAATLLPAGFLEAQDASSSFDPPVRLTAEGESITDLIYPTPVLLDVDGDGQLELVIGDLPGNLWLAERAEGDDDLAWSKLGKLQSVDGPLKFDNW